MVSSSSSTRDINCQMPELAKIVMRSRHDFTSQTMPIVVVSKEWKNSNALYGIFFVRSNELCTRELAFFVVVFGSALMVLWYCAQSYSSFFFCSAKMIIGLAISKKILLAISFFRDIFPFRLVLMSFLFFFSSWRKKRDEKKWRRRRRQRRRHGKSQTIERKRNTEKADRNRRK